MAVAQTSQDWKSVVTRHHPVGVSTGFMKASRGNWKQQVANAWNFSPFAVELSALAEAELESLAEYLSSCPRMPFRYLSVHGPSKDRVQAEDKLVDQLSALVGRCDGIVMHPDTMVDVELYARLGRALVVENMDGRKSTGQRADQLASLFEQLPDAGFCFDIAHAWSVDHSMAVAGELLDAFGARLRHVHLSSLSEELHHVSLTGKHEELFEPVLERCVDVPWILEAPPRAVR